MKKINKLIATMTIAAAITGPVYAGETEEQAVVGCTAAALTSDTVSAGKCIATVVTVLESGKIIKEKAKKIEGDFRGSDGHPSNWDRVITFGGNLW